MTKEKEKELNKVKVESYVKIKELQTRICRVGSYLVGLQYQLGEHMNFYHSADRELANEFKLRKVTNKPTSLLQDDDWIRDILADPVKSAKLFKELEKLAVEKAMDKNVK